MKNTLHNTSPNKTIAKDVLIGWPWHSGLKIYGVSSYINVTSNEQNHPGIYSYIFVYNVIRAHTQISQVNCTNAIQIKCKKGGVKKTFSNNTH